MSATAESVDVEVVEAKKPRMTRKMMLIVGAAILLLIGGGVTAYLLLGRAKTTTADKGAAAKPEADEGKGGETFVEVPPMVVNLRSLDGAPRLIKLRLMLVPASAAAGASVTARLPIVIDSFQPFLRELRPDDLAGAAAIFRIKEELLIRANAVTGAGSVKDVLIEDLIQQ